LIFGVEETPPSQMLGEAYLPIARVRLAWRTGSHTRRIVEHDPGAGWNLGVFRTA
jgi:hypothetical protein